MNPIPQNIRIAAAQCPGKIILSGEHAVVYGCPSLVMATSRYAHAELVSLQSDHVAIFFNGETVGLSHTNELPKFREEINLRYASYKEGKSSIREVVPTPADLLYFTVANFFHELKRPLDQGLEIALNLDIPMGRGMGSSAAVILALLEVLNSGYGEPFSQSELYELALTSENLQHGKSSGVDPYTCQHGGVLKFIQGHASPLPNPPGKLYLVNTGAPEATTGECVDAVRAGFADGGLWPQFTATSEYIEQAMLNNDLPNFRVGIRKNHQLLCALGVVPEPVENFIGTIMHRGGAAKVCGAGSIRGAEAGMVLVELETENPTRYVEEFGYSLEPLIIDQEGVRLV